MNGTTGLRHSVGGSGIGEAVPVATVVVYKDQMGYGMKVSGDKPVYVQSVKEGGAAERAGLHAGDKIIKVDGVNVMQSTHTEVVELIKASTQVVLTVQQQSHPTMATGLSSSHHHRPTSLSTSSVLVSPVQGTSLHRASTAPASCTERITGPQPVDNEKMRQLETQRIFTLQLMLENEQSHVDKLRSELAKQTAAGNANSIVSLQTELGNAERRCNKLQEQLDQFSSAHLGSSSVLSKHQRTKSSPEQLGIISSAEASRRFIATELMNELAQQSVSLNRPGGGRYSGIDLDEPQAGHRTPPGTPPPPYPAPTYGDSSCSSLNESVIDGGSPGMPMIQQPIISMEDDDMSDQEVGQLEDHGPFKLLSKLWQHHAHLAVFMNYVLSNSDPSSLLFYLITDLYKKGNAKEMKKWAYEIHSTFLVPGAPLRLNNVDENIAREIDNVLQNESDKEEILRKIFWKARSRAKEELNEQLADFQQKRIAGLGTLFGPSDAQLDESACDKNVETKIIETYLLPKMETYLEDIEKENIDQRKFSIAAGVATVLTKVFQVRLTFVDRVPTFVAKDKSHIKARLYTVKQRKMSVKGHNFVIIQYYTVQYCNHCQFIIGGIGPQGYQCSNCTLNVHRQCVRIVEENCPGPLVKKDKGNDCISKLMERIRLEKKPPSHQNQNQFHHVERQKRADEESSPLGDGENGEHRGSGLAGSARAGSERGRVSVFGSGEHADSMDDPSSREDISEMVQQNISSKPKTSNINRSESYKERIHHKRQVREKRKTSDPNLSKTKARGADSKSGGAFPGNSAGSSSNSSLSTRSLDSPSTSLEQVHSSGSATAAAASAAASWDSDVDVEPDPPDWTQGVSEEVLASLGNAEKKRQEVINELFHTERSHVRALKVLSQVFHKPMKNEAVLALDQIDLLFSNLDEMVQIHSQFNQAMKRKRKESPLVADVGDLLLEMFDNEPGERFELAASRYCAKQQVALRALREQRRKDPKLNGFLNEVEANPMCRRLQLKDHLLTGMIRLTKYPLLFENLHKYTPVSNERERKAVQRSLERSREILQRVNQAVREAEDYHRLVEMKRLIDRAAFDKVDHQDSVKEFADFDITKHRLIYEGPLQWRVVKAKPVDLHVVLLDDYIILLHRQDEKYVLKFFNQMNSLLSPIVRVSTVLVRHNAVDKSSLYLVNTAQKGAQIYDLVASSYEERQLWCKHISETAEVHKARDREARRLIPPSSSSGDLSEVNEDQQLLPEPVPIAQPVSQQQQQHQQVQQNSNEVSRPNDKPEQQDKETPTTAAAQQPQTELTDSAAPEHNGARATSAAPIVGTTSTGEPLMMVTCTQCSLIDPVEVCVEERPVHIAEPVFTPIELLRRKDDVIKQALLEKQSIVENILNISKPDAESAPEITPSSLPVLEKEPVELILSAIGQTNQLIELLNSALTVSETETVLATQSASPATVGCEATGCPAPRTHPHRLEPTVPVATLQPICNTLTSQLSQLLKIVKERDEERERLRKEFRRSRERLHAIDANVQRRETTEVNFSLPENAVKNEQIATCESSQDASNDGADKEIFVDAQSDLEAPPAATTVSATNEVKVSSDNEVMGDSVG
ncbi:rho guanine nucleotide exchange factor 12 isoform X2 [Copidosoma floridanum]|uniref:rho guanine nucleotide exchange factor 12 isoform X2 n=1 Tax=Copidosoma floridanum TaxID=29053 RepID=UPI000C6F921E|nr:rho guanine nucleotide exchange factor 12 isoform X2 [Copidosoma floridanum]